MLQREHSAILSTFIKLPRVINIFVLSIFVWMLKTGFKVYPNPCYNAVCCNWTALYMIFYKKNYWKTTITWSFSYTFFVKFHGKICLSHKMSVIYLNPCSNEVCCNGTALYMIVYKKSYWKTTITWSFSYTFFVKFHGKICLSHKMSVIYPNPCYIEVCCNGTALYMIIGKITWTDQ